MFSLSAAAQSFADKENAKQCNNARIQSLSYLITHSAKNKADPAALARGRNFLTSAKKALAANNKSECGKALKSGLAEMRIVYSKSVKSRHSSSRFCTTRYVNLLNNQIQTGLKHKYTAKAITSAKTRYASAKKARASKDLTTCGTDIKNGMRIMAIERSKATKAANARLCTKANLNKLNATIQKGKTLKVNARTLAAAKKRYDSAKKTMAARRLSGCGAQIKNGLSIMAKAMKSK